MFKQGHSAFQLAAGFHFRELLLGMVLMALLVALLFYRFRSVAMRHITRRHEGLAIDAIKDMDSQTFKRLLGSVDMPSWMTYPDFERVGWVNTVLGQLWPRLDASLSHMASEMLRPLFQENKPSWMHSVKLDRFTLGNRAPTITGVKVYGTEHSVPSEINMEVDFAWNGNQNMELFVRPVPKSMGPATIFAAIISQIVLLKVGLERVIMRGKLRVSWRPLMDEPPCIGAVKIAFVDMPSFSFDLNMYGGDLTLLPGVEMWLNAIIKEYVLGPYCLPEAWSYAFVPGINQYDRPAGMLFVTVKEATNVPQMDWFNPSDPYVTLFTRPKHKFKTQVKENTLHPVWNEDFRCLVHVPEQQQLTCVLYDYDTLGQPDVIGDAHLNIRDLKLNEKQDIWLDVKSKIGAAEDKGDSKITRAARKYLQKAKMHSNPRALRMDSNSCKLHLEVAYIKFSAQHFEAAMGMQGDAQTRESTSRPSGDFSHQPSGPSARNANVLGDVDIIDMLEGGLLLVDVKKTINLVHKPIYKGGYITKTHATVKVKVAGETKLTPTGTGRDAAINERLEFVLSGQAARDSNMLIEIEVWDFKWINDRKGSKTVPLQDIVQGRHKADQYVLTDTRHGQIILEFTWIPLLENR
ncbi:hypothetical protein WJX84_001563 [Apatococcus fuscideae]